MTIKQNELRVAERKIEELRARIESILYHVEGRKQAMSSGTKLGIWLAIGTGLSILVPASSVAVIALYCAYAGWVIKEGNQWVGWEDDLNLLKDQLSDAEDQVAQIQEEICPERPMKLDPATTAPKPFEASGLPSTLMAKSEKSATTIENTNQLSTVIRDELEVNENCPDTELDPRELHKILPIRSDVRNPTSLRPVPWSKPTFKKAGRG